MKDNAAMREYAEWARGIAHDPKHAKDLPGIVLQLANAILDPPKKRGRPSKPSLDDRLSDASLRRAVNEQTHANIAASIYAHTVNAYDVAHGRSPEYPGYDVLESQSEAIAYLKKNRLYNNGKRQGHKARAKEYTLKKMKPYAFTLDDLIRAVREKLRQSR